jgi:hypothetical protein
MRLLKLLTMLIFVVGSCVFGQEIKDEDIFVNSLKEMDHYPLAAWAGGHIEGVVVVRAKLDNDGKVIDAQALSGAKSLVPDTLENIKAWKFAVNEQKTVIVVYEYKIDKGLCNGSLLSQFLFYPPNLVTIRRCQQIVNTH